MNVQSEVYKLQKKDLRNEVFYHRKTIQIG